jgi:hypothetical protein
MTKGGWVSRWLGANDEANWRVKEGFDGWEILEGMNEINKSAKTDYLEVFNLKRLKI